MALERWIEGAEPLRAGPAGRAAGTFEEHRVARTRRLGHGTLACPACDAPVAPAGRMAPADALACPVCAHAAAVRDFLSLAAPSRPARVEVRVVAPPPRG